MKAPGGNPEVFFSAKGVAMTDEQAFHIRKW